MPQARRKQLCPVVSKPCVLALEGRAWWAGRLGWEGGDVGLRTQHATWPRSGVSEKVISFITRNGQPFVGPLCTRGWCCRLTGLVNSISPRRSFLTTSWLMHEGKLLSFKVKMAQEKTFDHYFYQVKGVSAELHIPPSFLWPSLTWKQLGDCWTHTSAQSSERAGYWRSGLWP